MTEKSGGALKQTEAGRRYLSLRVMFVLLIFLTSLPALLALGVVGYQGRNRTIDLVSKTASDFAAGLSSQYVFADELAENYLNTLTANSSVKALDYVRCERMFNERISHDSFFADVMLITAGGEVLAAGRPDALRQVPALLKDVTLSESRNYRGCIYSAAPYGEPLLPYLRGLQPDASGKPQFILVLLVRTSLFAKASERVSVPDGMSHTLLDRAGNFILRYPPSAQSHDGDKIAESIWEEVLSIPSDQSAIYLTHEGDPLRYIGFSRINSPGDNTPFLVVLTSLDKRDTLRGVSRLTSNSIAAVLLSVISIAFLILYIGNKRLIRPIEHIVEVTKRFARGDMSMRAEQEGYIGEIGMLAHAFDEMALSLEQRVRLGRSIEVEVREQANKDFLTGAFNRRAGLSILGNTVALSNAEAACFAIIFIDLDRFKMINDTYGHAEGDELLKSVARLLSSHLRADDILCRYGGDEFLIVLPHCDEQGVNEAWSRIRESVTLFNNDSSLDYQLSLSHGCAVFDPHAPVSQDELIEAADKAMYFDKESRKKEG